ncbi:hypothetical protein MSG28_001086 [Choristoneura fumiferana]|uniref:Uncharacterized protein n=1 Tax=Choristoneura fumiferana TaxID=7141 RepID=A0ACC0K3P0_CHOFU|nr:hypothetical protein MSG28_001086 [Choristoneura fumiferana]
MSEDIPRVLSIQSHVVHGYVGNKSAVFPLQVLGFEVDAINTVQFSTHTGYKHIKGNVLKNEEMEELIEGLILNEVDYYTHLITGYSRSPESLKQLAEIIKKLKQKNPQLIYVCDPVMGDNGKMYVPEDILPVYRDIVVPLADIITPNQFEAELMTGMPVKDLDGALKVIEALHQKGVKTVVLSSTELGDGDNIVAIASSKGEQYIIKMPKVDATFTGTGDLFAALFLAWSYKTNNNLKLTLERVIATLQNIVQDTYQKARAREVKEEKKTSNSQVVLETAKNLSLVNEPVVESVVPKKTVVELEQSERPVFTGPTNSRQFAVVESFKHAWKGYKEHAWGHDNLKPVSGMAFDWFSLGLTIVDALDTAYIMGLTEEFEEGREWISNELIFTKNKDVNFFEVTIRVLGGLLTNYHFTQDEMFLKKAEDLGDRLMAAFSSPSGIPYSDVNLGARTAHAPEWSHYSTTAEVTTVQLEFRELSRASNNPVFEDAAAAVSEKIHQLPKKHGLVPIFINPNTGQFLPHATITLGARGDSYYEYLLKQWLHTGKTIN